jgi:hypothetical protein
MRKLVVLACIFSLVVSAALVAGCAMEDDTPRTTREVVREFLDELASGDTGTAWDMLSARSQKLLHSEEEFESLVSKTLPDGDALESVEVVKSSTNGDVASVTVATVSDGKKQTDTVKLVKEDGVWKISLEPGGK